MQVYKNNLIFLTLCWILFQGNAFAQCGNCTNYRPSKFSLIYSYLIPGQIKQFTNPALRANQVINTVRNPSLLLSPCNPITNTTANLINRGFHNTDNTNNLTGSYIPPNPSVNENAYVSGFNENINEAENPNTTNNSYFDESTNSYVWVLPEP